MRQREAQDRPERKFYLGLPPVSRKELEGSGYSDASRSKIFKDNLYIARPAQHDNEEVAELVRVQDTTGSVGHFRYISAVFPSGRQNLLEVNDWNYLRNSFKPLLKSEH